MPAPDLYSVKIVIMLILELNVTEPGMPSAVEEEHACTLSRSGWPGILQGFIEA